MRRGKQIMLQSCFVRFQLFSKISLFPKLPTLITGFPFNSPQSRTGPLAWTPFTRGRNDKPWQKATSPLANLSRMDLGEPQSSLTVYLCAQSSPPAGCRQGPGTLWPLSGTAQWCCWAWWWPWTPCRKHCRCRPPSDWGGTAKHEGVQGEGSGLIKQRDD